jgi:putative FmdB family regulatory protein
MPIYTYRCETCKTAFEAFASIQKKETGWQPTCPKCGSSQTRQTYQPIFTLDRSQNTSAGGSCCTPRRG